MSSEYNSNFNYWRRRQPMENLIAKIEASIPGYHEKRLQIEKMQDEIQLRSDTMRYRCIYVFRDGQEDVDTESEERGSYRDSWYRSLQFDMDVQIDNELNPDDPIPTPGVPIVAILKPFAIDMASFGINRTLTFCWHPKCQDHRSKLTEDKIYDEPLHYMLCQGHADEEWISGFTDLIDGKEVSNTEIKEAFERVIKTYTKQLQFNINRRFQTVSEFHNRDQVPNKTMKIRTYHVDEDDVETEDEVFVDLVSCTRFEI